MRWYEQTKKQKPRRNFAGALENVSERKLKNLPLPRRDHGSKRFTDKATTKFDKDFLLFLLIFNLAYSPFAFED